jgi:hypothetical protein
MTFDVAGVLADAWQMWKRDRELLLAVAGLFLFLPNLTLELLVPPPPAQTGSGTDMAAFKSWLTDVAAWWSHYGPLVSVIGLVAMFGTLMIFTLYLDPRRPNVRVALVRTLTLSPRYLLAMFFVSLAVGIGFVLLILPGIYALGRLMLTVPSLVADRSRGVLGAIERSLVLTAGNGLVLAGFACITLFSGAVLSAPFRALGKAMDGAPMANPVVAVLLDSGAAAGAAAGVLAAILIQVALYRRLAASNGI